jgi:hypothetical protein
MCQGAWRALPVLTLFAATCVIGCSRGPRLAEVKGVVKLNGKPMPKVMVEFVPDAKTGARSTGTTDENGQYALVCDDGQRPGAIVGPHRVLLHDLAIFGDKVLGRKWEQVGTPGGPPAIKSRIPSQYESATHTPLRKEVKDGAQTIDLEVKGP